jgi:hypothetical protein
VSVGRLLATAIFALAAGSAAVLSAGVAIPAHRMPVGTPASHAMPPTAYRLGFLIDPTAGPESLTPVMAALHRALAQAGVPVTMEMPAEGTAQANAEPFFQTSGLALVHDLGLALALLAVLVPALPRPTRRLIAVLPLPAREATQWSVPVPRAPPRGIALSARSA